MERVRWNFVALAAVVMVTCSLGAIITPSDMLASVEVEPTLTTPHTKRSPTLGPEPQYHLTVDIDGTAVTKSLDLITTHHDADMYVLDGEDVKPVDFPVKREWATYGSPDAAMLIKHHPEHGPRMEGSLRHNDIDYFLQPLDDSPRHVMHTVHKAMRFDPPVDEVPEHIKRHIRSKRSIGRNEIELMMIFDDNLYKLWKKITPSGETTLELMKEYYGLLINEINYRYQTLKTNYQVDIGVVMGGLLVDMDGRAKPYTTKPTATAINGYAVLDSFTPWVKKKFPNIDDVQLHVGLSFGGSLLGLAWFEGVCGELSSGIVTNTLNYRAVQVAAHELGHNMNMKHDESGECKDNTYIMHASSLNLLGRSTGRNFWSFSSCSMKNTVDYIKRLNDEKRNCMKKRTARHDLSRYGFKMPGAGLTYDQMCNVSLPGSTFCVNSQQGYKLEEICLGIMCQVDKTGKTGCLQRYALPGLPCGDYKVCKHGNCVEDRKLGKPMRTDCPYGERTDGFIGPKKLTCVQAVAKSHSYCYDNAKDCCGTCPGVASADAKCRYGDRDVGIELLHGLYPDCASAAKIEPGICYRDAKACCKTCEALLNTAESPCHYGDKPLYYRIGVTGGEIFKSCKAAVAAYTGVCYVAHNIERCCKSCKDVRDPGNKNCVFGDEAGKVVYTDTGKATCRDAITKDTSGVCYRNKKRCCDTCAKHYRKNQPGCEYGDKPGLAIEVNRKATTCRDAIKSEADKGHCYRSDDECCETCAKYKSSDPNCPYGDKPGNVAYKGSVLTTCKEAITAATSGLCATYGKICCETCKKFETGGGKDCRYGDSKADCKTSITADDASQCYDGGIREKCCKTCAMYKQDNGDCAYGDRELVGGKVIKGMTYTTCKAAVTKYPWVCYKTNDVCCESCTKYKNPSHANCEYGDKNVEHPFTVGHTRVSFPDCVTAIKKHPGLCYRYKDVYCCDSCRKIEDKTHAGCEYGDKPGNQLWDYSVDPAVWAPCAKAITASNAATVCKEADTRKNCCSSCRKFTP